MAGLEFIATLLHLEAHILPSMLGGKTGVAADGGSEGGRLMTLALDGKLTDFFSLSLSRWSATRNWTQQRLLSSRYRQNETPSLLQNGVVLN